MEITKEKKTLYTMILIALFTALAFIGTMLYVPFGPSKVHLGNFVCILAALLCGPFVGGISGALGMGLNDIFIGGYGPDTYIRTFIVKFILGFVTGFLFRLFLKKSKDVKLYFFILDGVFLVSFITFLILYLVNGPTFTIGTKTFKNSVFLVVCLGVLFVLFVAATIFAHKLKPINRYVLLITSIGCTINVACEFIIKIPFKVAFASYSWQGAFYYSIVSLPSALLTLILTIVLVVLIYLPVYVSTKKFNKLNDVYDLIEGITSFDLVSSSEKHEGGNVQTENKDEEVSSAISNNE